MTTYSNAELIRQIAYEEKTLRKCKPGGWTAEIISEKIKYLRKQLALPRDQRSPFRRGKL